MLREFILSHKIARNLKNRVSQLTTKYDAAESIGVFFHMSAFDYETVKRLREIFLKDEKEVSIIGYIPKMNDPVIHDTVVKREISLSGTINSAEFEKFNKKKYDFLIILGSEPDTTFNFLVTSCNASCRVGLYDEAEETAIADLQIKTTKGSEVEEIAKYLKMIR